MSDSALIIPFWSDAEVTGAIRPALDQMERRQVLAYPTETVYGFGGAIDRDSVDALVRMKGRPKNKPFLLLIAGSEMLAKLDLKLPSFATNLAARHWPGALTLVLPGGEKRVPEPLRGPEGGIAVRWTSHRNLQRLIQAHGDAIDVHQREPPRGSARHFVARNSRAVAWGDCEWRAASARWRYPAALATVHCRRLYGTSASCHSARSHSGGGVARNRPAPHRRCVTP
jgi:Putative translation factor (SUA5)